jgi:hypothetical protein
VHEQQRQHGRADGEVGDDQQPAAAHAVDHKSRERREQGRRCEEEDDHPGGAAASRELLGPHAEREPHRAVAEDGERLAGNVEPHVAACQHAAHQGSTG